MHIRYIVYDAHTEVSPGHGGAKKERSHGLYCLKCNLVKKVEKRRKNLQGSTPQGLVF